MISRVFVLLSFCLLAFPCSVSFASTPESKAIDTILEEQKNQLLVSQRQNYWHYPMFMGVHYTSQVWLVSHWLGMVSPKWDREKFKSLLLRSQLSDGSWPLLPDSGISEGDINPTILNYWALKSLELPTSHPQMLRARAFVLSRGGAEKAHKFTQIFLMCFGNQPWSDFPTIPQIPFFDFGEFVKPQVARWIVPHISPMIYLAQRQVVKDLGPQFKVGELYLRDRSLSLARLNSFNHLNSDLKEARKMLWDQRPYGSWGGSTSSTMFTQMALLHAAEAFPNKRSLFINSIRLGQHFNELMVLGSHESAYLGVAVDGRYWDTALVGQTLAELGVNHSALTPAAQYLLKRRDKSGGYGFGIDFEMDMDTDDTAEILLFYHRIGFDGPSNRESFQWLVNMQNSDGGWGAFDRNNVGNWLLHHQTKVLADTADFFDESSPDVTGHILEAFATYTTQLSLNSPTVQRAIDYLRQTQEMDGSWYGRWGVNYIYGTGAAMVGLRRVGIPNTDPMMIRGDLWLKSCQNHDGGFGETSLTYKDSTHKCQGHSTPSQTAWAVLALLETNPWYHPSITSAINYLMKTYQPGIGWSDLSVNGTGQPTTVPMQYVVYPKVFPAMALARFRKMQGRL